LTPKIKNWCQNGVKSRKSDDYKEKSVANPVKSRFAKKIPKN